MTARCTAVVLLATLGSAAALPPDALETAYITDAERERRRALLREWVGERT